MAPPTRTTLRDTQTVPRRDGAAREPPGTLVLDRYRLHRPLGAGGFGTVWLAYDGHLEREVAVKMLPRARVIGGRFEREARAAARLNHPGIVTLYEAAVDVSAAYLVSELVRGMTFGELLEAGRLSDRDIVAVGIALCDALEHAHAQGVVHRDVKPSNVLVPERPSSPSALAKLTDFGVARVIGGNTLTRTGEVVGTAAYMAPEQAEGREVDAAADLYSLSLVLYEALTGLNPVATGAAASRARRLGAHLPPLRRYRRDLPPELGRAIDMALRPRPRERGTLIELKTALVVALEEVEDQPGIVDSPLHPISSPPSDSGNEAPFGRAVPLPDEAPSDVPSIRWPERALAGAGAAATAGWLLATAFPAPPLAPAGAALVAAVVVAALPRIGWLTLTIAAAIALSAAGRPGAALVVAVGLLLPVLLLPHAATRWPLVAGAPALGLALLAGAWPALASRGRGPWRRAAVAALGWVWLVLAGLLTGRGLYTRLAPGAPNRAHWMSSPGQIGHLLRASLESGALTPAIVWAVAAVLLPWVVRGKAPVRVVLVTVWSAAVASATTSMLHTNVSPHAGTVVLGAVAGALIALVPTLLRVRKGRPASSDTAAGLA